MSYEDYQKGLSGIGSGSGMDYLKGVNEREQQRRESRPVLPTPAATPSPPVYSGPTWTAPAPSPGRPHVPAAPETMTTMAKGGASLFAVLFVGHALLGGGAWTWPQLVGGGLGAAVVGALCGALLYIALKVLAFALKVAVGLLVIGIVLHFINVINLWAVLARLRHAVGL
ncbi:MAG: hypothetical protein EOP82_08170 [Variovorax sp.]|nr:MAG: hypothetical protein EOP82_08170 [Variovorax sp.]